MTDLPTTGGSFILDPETGKLRPAQLTDQEELPERNLLVPDLAAAAAGAAPTANPDPAAPAEPAPKRRSTNKGGI